MIRQAFHHKQGRRKHYTFECDCGQLTVLRGDSTAKSCQQEGCSISTLRKHGRAGTRLYNIWDGIKNRCVGKHHSNKHYKHNGITICPEWLEFSAFEKWALSNNYSSTLTIDRIDITKDYCPTNCEWITRAENTRRQYLDGHGRGTQVVLNSKLNFLSIAKAAEYIHGFTTTKPKSIAATLERRIKTNDLKPYKGFIITQSSEGG